MRITNFTLRGPMAPKHDIFQNVFEMIFLIDGNKIYNIINH